MRATRYFAYSGEVAIAALVVAVIGLMILPLPTPLIDTLLGINITLSVVLLMVTMYVPDSISLSSFPSLLLFTTLLRLSLNIASTKSILLHAEAGHIIESFGELVVGGNLVVGLVVFLIITTVQFIVIAKGSERVAEVGARFTLDAMPGKQMSIDADLRGGNLTADEARRKRARAGHRESTAWRHGRRNEIRQGRCDRRLGDYHGQHPGGHCGGRDLPRHECWRSSESLRNSVRG